jgi:hypothetical protein
VVYGDLNSINPLFIKKIDHFAFKLSSSIKKIDCFAFELFFFVKNYSLEDSVTVNNVFLNK